MLAKLTGPECKVACGQDEMSIYLLAIIMVT